MPTCAKPSCAPHRADALDQFGAVDASEPSATARYPRHGQLHPNHSRCRTAASRPASPRILQRPPTPIASGVRSRRPRAACTSGIARHGLQVNLSGDLGTGKTSLSAAGCVASVLPARSAARRSRSSKPIRSLLPALSDRSNARLEAESNSSLDFYHFDFYRFADPAEFSTAGFRDYFGPGPHLRDRVAGESWGAPANGRCFIALVEATGRRATLSAGSELGHACLDSALRTSTNPPPPDAGRRWHVGPCADSGSHRPRCHAAWRARVASARLHARRNRARRNAEVHAFHDPRDAAAQSGGRHRGHRPHAGVP